MSTGESYALVVGSEVLIYATDSGEVRACLDGSILLIFLEPFMSCLESCMSCAATVIHHYPPTKRSALAGFSSLQLVRTLKLPTTVHSIAFYDSGNRMVVGANSDTIYIVSTASGEIIHSCPDAHTARVRNVAAFDSADPKCATLFTSSSDGYVKVRFAHISMAHAH